MSCCECSLAYIQPCHCPPVPQKPCTRSSDCKARSHSLTCASLRDAFKKWLPKYFDEQRDSQVERHGAHNPACDSANLSPATNDLWRVRLDCANGDRRYVEVLAPTYRIYSFRGSKRIEFRNTFELERDICIYSEFHGDDGVTANAADCESVHLGSIPSRHTESDNWITIWPRVWP